MSKKRSFEKMDDNEVVVEPLITDKLLPLHRDRVLGYFKKLIPANRPCLVVTAAHNPQWLDNCIEHEFIFLLEVLGAMRDQPSSWTTVLSIDSLLYAHKIVFDLKDVRSRMKATKASFTTDSLYHTGYRKFLVDEDTLPVANNTTEINPLINRDDIIRPRSAAATRMFAQQTARMAQEYVARIELVIDAKKNSSQTSLPIETPQCLLLEPFSLYSDDFGRLFHVPMVQGVVQKAGFTPIFLRSESSLETRVRVALLISLVRMVYLFTFHRAFDDDFSEELICSRTLAEWCARLRTNKFPDRDAFGMPASVQMINWMFACLTNRIKTTEIGAHSVFAEYPLSDWRSSIPFGKNKFLMACRDFYMLTSQLNQLNNAQISCKVLRDPAVNLDPINVHTNFRKLSQKQASEVAFSLEVWSACEQLFSLNVRYDQGFTLTFEYIDCDAFGIGVGKEIIFRALEGMKYWWMFVFREDENMLDFAHNVKAIKPHNHMLLLLMVSIYWCSLRRMRMPYILSPSILGYMFNLPTQYIHGYALDHKRQMSPDFVNNILSADDQTLKSFDVDYDDDEDNESTAPLLPSSQLDVLKQYAIYRTVGSNEVSCVSREVSDYEATGVLRNFKLIVCKVFDDPNCLSFLLSEQEYGPNQGRSAEVTATIALSLLDFENFEAKNRVDFEPSSELRTVPTIESQFAPSERLLIHYLTHYYLVMKTSKDAEEKMFAIRVVGAAFRQTVIFLVRWICETPQKSLARLWKILHGHETLVPSQLVNLPTNDVDFVLALMISATVSPKSTAAPDYSPMNNLFANLACRSNVFESPHMPTTASKTKNSIHIHLREPDQEAKYQMAPRFATCTSTLQVSICHGTYESFAEALDLSLSDDSLKFTLNT